MESSLIGAFSDVMSLNILMFVFGGTFLGIVIGALPGLSATMGVAVLLPITYYLSPAEGMALLLGIYTGGIYGGSIAAILLNIPGCPASLMTTLDGYPMSRRGEGGRAIGLATVSSFIGGVVGVIALMFFSPLLARAALSFGPPEYAALAVLGLTAIVVVVTKSIVKGFIGAVLGLLLGTVGMDPVVSVQRFTYGQIDLLTGLNYIPVVIGMFGLSEVIGQVMAKTREARAAQKVGQVVPDKADMRVIMRNAIHPSWIGTLVGALPGAGGTIASIISYNRAQTASDTPEKFGTGIPEGIVASETANNASIGGAMVPLMTLGIPGSAATAVLLGALLMHNLQPGPMLFVSNAKLVYTIFGIMLVANVAMLILGLISAKIFPQVVNLPQSALLPIITVLCTVGSFALNNSLFEVGIMLVSGLAGYLLKEAGIGGGPIILGLILGPIAEGNFRGSLELSGGNPLIFFERPLSLFLLFLTLCLLCLPFIRNLYLKRRSRHNIDITEA